MATASASVRSDAFIDTCVLVYATAPHHAHFDVAVTGLLGGGVTSPQVLAEFTDVARSQLGRSWAEVHEALSIFRVVCTRVAPVRSATFETAMELMQQEKLAMSDAMVAACALKAGCSRLVTDMATNGRVFGEVLVVANPFGTATTLRSAEGRAGRLRGL